MTNVDELAIEKLIYRYLDAVATAALREFLSVANVGESLLRSMVQLSGRGYRLPTTIDGWRSIYGMLMEWDEDGIFLESD